MRGSMGDWTLSDIRRGLVVAIAACIVIVLGISALPIGTGISPDSMSPSVGGKVAISLMVYGVTDPIFVNETSPINVTVVDDQGKVQTKYHGTVRFSTTDPLAILPPDYTFTREDAGRHGFWHGMLYFQTLGDQTLTVTDVSNPTIKGSQTGITVIDWPRPNTQPVANFTVAYSPPSATVVTDASSSSDNEDPTSALRVRWDWESDWNFDTSWTTDKIASHTYSSGGFHYIALEVMDTGGLTSTTYMNVSIDAYPPEAVFTVSPQVASTSSWVWMDATWSYDMEDPSWLLQVRWDWEDDGIYDTAWTNYKNAYHQYNTGGSYTIRLQVMDTGGLTGETTRTVIVDGMVPVADAGPDQFVNDQQIVYFDGSGSFDDVGISYYTWTAGYNNMSWMWLTGPNPSYSFPSPDRYVVTLTVSDGASNFDFDTMVVDFGHTIAKSSSGKVSDTVVWTYSPETNGVWRAQTENHGLTSMVYDVYDMTPNGTGVVVMEQKFRFSQLGAYPSGTMWSNPVNILAGHTYTVKAKPGGRAGTYAVVYDEFTPDTRLKANFSWSANGLSVVVNPSSSLVPPGYSCRYTLRWGDGSMSTGDYIGYNQFHTYSVPGIYSITLKIMDISGCSDSMTQTVTVTEYQAPTARIDYRLYDMFEQPWGDWWQWRLPAFKSDIILSNKPHAYTMVVNPDMRNLQGIIYAPYRWNATATNLENVSVHSPEFMPVLGTQWVNGSSVDMQIQFQYLDNASWYGYWKPVWGTNWNWSSGVMDTLMPAQFVDGYYIGTLYTISLNREAALEWLGMPMTDDPAAWWLANRAAYMTEWQNWIRNEGNFRLDIWPSYEWPYIDLATMMDLVEEADGKLTLKIAHFNWGFECLINRWLDEAGICAHQPYMEDFHLSAHYAEDTATVTYDAVCQYNLHAVKANQSLDGAAWVWEPQRMDYVQYSSMITGYESEFNPWAFMQYTSWNSGDGYFGNYVMYDCTPMQFNLVDGMSLTIHLPTGNNVTGYKGQGLPCNRTSGAIYELKRGNTSAYDGITVRGEMTLGYSMTGLGPDAPNLWNYYSSVNKTLTLFGPMNFDNYRFPNDLLYHSAPWIEFNINPAV